MGMLYLSSVGLLVRQWVRWLYLSSVGLFIFGMFISGLLWHQWACSAWDQWVWLFIKGYSLLVPSWFAHRWVELGLDLRGLPLAQMAFWFEHRISWARSALAGLSTLMLNALSGIFLAQLESIYNTAS